MSNEFLDEAIKQPPHNIEAEQSVIGGLMLDNSGWDKIADVVTEQDFYAGDLRMMFRAIQRLVESGKVADAITVAEFLEQHALLEKAGGLVEIGKMVQNTPSAANIRHYAKIVRERALVRRVISASTDVTSRAYALAGMSAADLVDFAQAKMQSVSEIASRGNSGPQTLSAVMGKVVEKIDALHLKAMSGRV